MRVVMGRRPATGRSSPPGTSSSDGPRGIAAARRVVEDLTEGVASPHARRGLRALRHVLGAPGAGFVDLSGASAWSGNVPPEEATTALVDKVTRSESPGRRPPLIAAPVHAWDELCGVLVLAGPVATSEAREAAALVGRSFERGRLEESSARGARTELRALRAEISPHFVHNALTVIASLVRSEPDRARELMGDFADYTRYSLAGQGEYTTLSDEFHAIETYLALQRAVLGDRLRAELTVAPEVLPVVVPCLVLEPLVENAIRHGIEPRPSAGTVRVRGEAEGNDCLISVEDDGVGMDSAVCNDILAGKGAAGQVGLANVDRRLRAVYGPWFGLVVETAPGAGTRVWVRVPRFQPGVMPP